MNTPPHVVLVDDNPDVRLHLGGLLQQMGYRVDSYGEPQRVFEQRPWRADSILLLDMRMPGMSGLQVQQRLAELALTVPIVFISGESHPREVVEAMKEGAVDFLVKPFGREQLERALTAAAGRGRVWRETEARRAELKTRCSGLSQREWEVLPLLLRGHSNKAIGEILGLQAETIKKHRAAIYEKLLVEELTGLIGLFDGIQPSAVHP